MKIKRALLGCILSAAIASVMAEDMDTMMMVPVDAKSWESAPSLITINGVESAITGAWVSKSPSGSDKEGDITLRGEVVGSIKVGSINVAGVDEPNYRWWIAKGCKLKEASIECDSITEY